LEAACSAFLGEIALDWQVMGKLLLRGRFEGVEELLEGRGFLVGANVGR